jgi:DNA replication protein DnaC
MRSLGDILTPSTGQVRAEFCDKHGDFEARHITGRIWSTCLGCSADRCATKAIRKAENDAKVLAAHWQKTLSVACIPERFLDRTLENYGLTNEGQHKAHEFSKVYAESFKGVKTGRCAIFSGERGTGKTHLAIGIAQHVMRNYGKTAVFVTVQRLIRAVRDTWRKGSTMSESDVVAMFTSPDLLILDEIGVQAGSENEKHILFDVLNERYEQRKSTLLLTNLTVEECKIFLGERVFDRLREDGGEVIPFDWASERGAKA